MDTELLRTFLEVNRTRHFGRAAEHLCLTQSAVSARIRLLEETLGVALFTRLRNNVQLTPQGERLVRHAEAMLNTWTRARQEIALSATGTASLAVGAVPGLWELLLQDWLLALTAAQPRLAVTAEASDGAGLLRRVRERTLDLAFAFEAPPAGEVIIVPLADIRLLMVSARPDLRAAEALERGDYVLVDWGTGFASQHAHAFAGAPPPRLRIGLGRLAHALVLARGGSAYLPEVMVAEDMAAGRLHPVADAPPLQRATYAFHHPEADDDGRLGGLLAGLLPVSVAAGEGSSGA
jgi:DNA-binding transcriptional LysR family regulator